MNLQKLDITKFNTASIDDYFISKFSYFFLIKELTQILLEDKDKNAPDACNLYCDIGSNELLIVLGESWSYGDGLGPTVQVDIDKEDVPFRLTGTYGARLAYKYKTDLLMITQPGDSNSGIYDKLTRIVPSILATKQYSSITFTVQLTSPGRDLRNPSFDVILKELPNKTFNLNEWLEVYEKTLITKYIEFITKTTNVEVYTVFWKNFRNFFIDTDQLQTKNIGFASKCWSEYLFELTGLTSTYPFNMELDVDWSNSRHIIYTLDELNKNADDWENYVNNLRNSPFIGSHPNVTGNWLWAEYLNRNLVELKG